MRRYLSTLLAILLFLGAVLPAATAAEFTTEPLIAAGGSHTVALRSDGTVWAWGANHQGQLGNSIESFQSHCTPVQVQNISNVIDISAGVQHTVALRNDGTVWAWGLNFYEQLGGYSSEPRQIQSLSNITNIAAGRLHNVVLRNDGTVWAWGVNRYGQLGDGTSGSSWSDELEDWVANDRPLPVQVLGPGGVGHLSLSEDTLAVFPFSDVPRTHWARGAVTFSYEHSLMQGTGGSSFAPDTTLSRAMVVTILHRLAGEPPATSYPASTFSDVPPGQWFSDAIAWASHHEIVFGTGDGHFAPHADVTREQFATMLHRYAMVTGFSVAVSEGFNLTISPDYSQISTWANEPMRWAGYNRLVTGTDTQGTLNPNGNATRAQCATILQRFVGVME